MSDRAIDYERVVGKTVIGGLKGAAIGTLVSAFTVAVGYALSLPWHLVAGSASAVSIRGRPPCEEA